MVSGAGPQETAKCYSCHVALAVSWTCRNGVLPTIGAIEQGLSHQRGWQKGGASRQPLRCNEATCPRGSTYGKHVIVRSRSGTRGCKQLVRWAGRRQAPLPWAHHIGGGEEEEEEAALHSKDGGGGCGWCACRCHFRSASASPQVCPTALRATRITAPPASPATLMAALKPRCLAGCRGAGEEKG